MAHYLNVEENINTMEEADQIKYIKETSAGGNLIKFIENPSVDVQLAAIKSDQDSIHYIKNISDDVIFKAIELTKGDVIQHVVNATSEMRKLAINIGDPYIIRSINNPTLEEQILAVTKYPISTIQYIKEPSIELQLIAVRLNPSVISYLRDVPEIVQLAAVEDRPTVISRIRKPSMNIKLVALRGSSEAIYGIPDATAKLQRLALKKINEFNPVTAVHQLNRPCAEMLCAAFAYNADKTLHELIYVKNKKLPNLLKTWNKETIMFDGHIIDIYSKYDVKILHYKLRGKSYVIGVKRMSDGNIGYFVGCQKGINACEFLGRIHYMDDDDDLTFRELLTQPEYDHRKVYIQVIKYCEFEYDRFGDEEYDGCDDEDVAENWFDTHLIDNDRKKYDELCKLFKNKDNK